MSDNVPSKKIVQNFDPSQMTFGKEQEGHSDHWEIRTQERDYAYLTDKNIEQENRYGQLIDLVELTGLPADRPLYINDNESVGSNPNRNKQHGFFFTADNCIGCHACEAACSEKNENPAHLAFRSVGYVEGGSYPDYKRMNISMACNHCDDPVCLKGCPTRAYTKHAEYGAVLQDPETCFGCGYCTWVCPYNAPQLDPIKGQVSKCNMCVDRLEVGLKPSCVTACVGNALDFGIIENTPENREQCKTDIPGFPDPEITQPNIRFQQTKTMPMEMTRTDSIPLKYHRSEKGTYKPVVDQKFGKTKYWNFSRLSSRENPLVLFTLSTQAAFGAFLLPFIAGLIGITAFEQFMHSSLFLPLVIISAGLTGFGLLMSVTHLGKPMKFYRGFNNLRHSPVCREGLGLSLFAASCGALALFAIPANPWLTHFSAESFGLNLNSLVQTLPIHSIISGLGIFALVAGFGGLYYMNRCYRIKARPFWNHLQTGTSFAGSSLTLGATMSGAIIIPTLWFNNQAYEQATFVLGLFFVLGIAIEGFGLILHNHDLVRNEDEGGAAHYVQYTTFGKTYILRNTMMILNLLAATSLLAFQFFDVFGAITIIGWAILILVNLTTALISRALFYILVIPTTMPGAFFWKNKGFEEHAREIGLADNPATGVVHWQH